MKEKIRAGMRRSKFFYAFLFISFFTTTAIAQVRISGKVTGNDGNGIPGISVVIKNTNIGTATDVNGNYSMDANVKAGNYVLEFSGVGFKTRESTLRVGSDQNYAADVQLVSDALGMDEVVITGTTQGTTRRQLGNYVSTLKADQINKGAAANVLQALQGKNSRSAGHSKYRGSGRRDVSKIAGC